MNIHPLALRDDVKNWANAGKSGPEIAAPISKQHGVKMSRSAVAGLVARLGLKLARKGPVYPSATVFAPAPKAVMRAAIMVDDVPTPPRTRVNMDVFEVGGGVPFLDVTRAQCRWPVQGDGADMHVCEEAVAHDGAVYCAAHHKCAVSRVIAGRIVDA